MVPDVRIPLSAKAAKQGDAMTSRSRLDLHKKKLTIKQSRGSKQHGNELLRRLRSGSPLTLTEYWRLDEALTQLRR